MGVRLAAMFADAGQAVVLGSRDLARAKRIASGLRRTNITSGSYEEATDAPIVLPAMFIRDGLFDQLEELRPALRGKLFVDITNPFNDDYSDFILPWDTSGAEQIQARLPEARVVGAFKNVWWEVFDAPLFGDTLSDVFVVGDDAAAKQTFFQANHLGKCS
jgi:8-hydroxy-5-deazaflavin:NADPH oxidoreductase